MNRVRSGAFTPGDVTGSTFTVTSLGGQGMDSFTPIVNAPEVAILGFGHIVSRRPTATRLCRVAQGPHAQPPAQPHARPQSGQRRTEAAFLEKVGEFGPDLPGAPDGCRVVGGQQRWTGSANVLPAELLLPQELFRFFDE